jgi:ParB family transcriptional regulator, chromosome partitioning protein
MAARKKASGRVYKMLPIGDISPGANQRKFLDNIPELAALIKESGWIATIVVTSDGKIVAGERRWQAAKLLGVSEMHCEIFDGSLQEYLDRNAQENLGRKDFRFIEIARIFHSQRHNLQRSDKEIAAKTGYNADTVCRYINVLEKCHPKIIQKLDSGDIIAIDMLCKLATIPDKEVQLLRLNQWQGNPVEASAAPAPSKQRNNPLRRKRMIQLIKLLQDTGATDETIQVAQFMAGMRTTLPNKWHLRLSLKPRMPARESGGF